VQGLRTRSQNRGLHHSSEYPSKKEYARSHSTLWRNCGLKRTLYQVNGGFSDEPAAIRGKVPRRLPVQYVINHSLVHTGERRQTHLARCCV
jgi:hypothetical protein